MTARQMQKLSAEKRWKGKTPEQRSAIMRKVRKGSRKGQPKKGRRG